jgi:tetratricopeptide (TPR) repeat protein
MKRPRIFGREASTPVVTAKGGSVVAGESIIDSTITVGLSEAGVGQAVSEAQKPLLEHLSILTAQIAREKGIEVAPLRAVLEKIGEAGIADEHIPARLARAADELVALRRDLERLRNDRPELAAIRETALALIDAGDLDGARGAFNRGREVARTLRVEASRSEAEFLAEGARIDHLQLAYPSAAAKYAEVAELIANIDRDVEWEYRVSQANELYTQGLEFGDNLALGTSVEVSRSLLEIRPRAEWPLDWAMTQNNLGNALSILGERESGTARLDEAVVAYRAALEERTRERVPLAWAATQRNLQQALELLRQRSPERG